MHTITVRALWSTKSNTDNWTERYKDGDMKRQTDVHISSTGPHWGPPDPSLGDKFMYPRMFVWGNPPSTTLTQISWIDFPLHPHSILFCTTLTIVVSPQNYNFSFFVGSKTSGKAQHLLARSAHQPDLLLTPLQYNHQVAYYRAITCCHKPTEEFFPCVAKNVISVHSPCSPFTIYASRPGRSIPSRQWCHDNHIHIPARKLLHHGLHLPHLSQIPLQVSGRCPLILPSP